MVVVLLMAPSTFGGDPSVFAGQLSEKFNRPVAVAADDTTMVAPFHMEVEAQNSWADTIQRSGFTMGKELGALSHRRLDISAYLAPTGVSDKKLILPERPFEPQEIGAKAIDGDSVTLRSQSGRAFLVSSLQKLNWGKPLSVQWNFQKLGVRLAVKNAGRKQTLRLIASALGGELSESDTQFRLLLDPMEQKYRMLSTSLYETKRLPRFPKNIDTELKRARWDLLMAAIPSIDEAQMAKLWATAESNISFATRNSMERNASLQLFQRTMDVSIADARKNGVGSLGAETYAYLQQTLPDETIKIYLEPPLTGAILIRRRSGGTMML
ncbi:hypothetical protein BH11ARM2_BH11ARM2_15600 [soil metagenome]